MKTHALIGILAVLTLIALAGCSNNITKKAVEDKEIKIGLMVPLTQDLASLGQSTKKAVQLAVEEINNGGGINGKKLKVIYEDDKCNAKEAASIANKLINLDKVNYIVGSICSSSTLAMAPLAENSNTIVISPGASSPDITNAGDFIFRDYPSDTFEGKFVADFAYNELNARKTAVISCLSDYCVGLKDVFSKRFGELGGKIVEIQEFEQGSTDLKTSLTKIKQSDPDLVYFVSYTESAINGLKQAKEVGINVPIIGPTTWTDQTIWESTGEYSEGVMYAITNINTPEDFAQKFHKRFGEDAEITLCATQGYDAIYLIKNAIEKAGDDPVAVKEELYKVREYEGASGTISFDENGDISEANHVIMIIKNGMPVRRE